MRNKMSKWMLAILLVLCLAVSISAFNTKAEETSTVTKIDSHERVWKEYDAEEAKAYLAGENDYPELDGYLFAGWYTEKTCSQEFALNGEKPTEAVYALYVPEHVLSVKAQVSARLVDDTITESDKTASIRFVTTVDSLVYQQVGFEISYIGTDGKLKQKVSASKKVYERLYVTDTDSNEIWEETPDSLFCGVSKYFRAYTVTGVPVDNYQTEFTVKPYWITMDGDKVYGVESTKTVENGCLRENVYVSADGQNIPYHGSKENPYLTFDYAMARVADSGTVNLVGEIQIVGEGDTTGWPAHNKEDITITGGTLDVTTDDLCINDGVTFTNMILKVANTDVREFNRIFAEGNHVVIASDVTVSNQEPEVQIFGGGMNNSVESTNLEVNAGTFSMICGGSSGQVVTKDTNLIVGGNVSAGIIYGGGYSGAVQGNTNLTVSGTFTANEMYGGGYSGNVGGNTNIYASGAVDIVKIHGGGYTGNVQGNVNITAGSGMNPNADYTNHDYTYLLNGGCHSGIVYGNINIDVQEGATFNYVHGGVGGDPSNMVGVVKGSIDIKFAGKTYGLYGGSLNGTNADTHIRVVGGEVYQIFGGTRKLTMEGNADVRIEGGIVHRRIYGGSYNNYTGSWESPSRQVKGYACVTISAATGVNLNKEDDNALSALSRYNVAQTDEWGVLIFEDGLYDTYKSKIKGALESTSNPSYHYLVKANTGGEVHSAGEYLNIKPDSGYVATVYQVVDGVEVEKHYTESDSYYKLPGLNASTDKTEILVKFETEKKTTFSQYEAKIGTVYYETLEQALEVLDRYEDAEIEDIGEEKRLITVETENSKYGTITVDKKYCFVGDTVVIKESELLDTAYYLAELEINDETVSLNLDGTYSLTPSVGGKYVVTAVHKKAIYEPRSPWILVNQHQSTDENGVINGTVTLPSGGYGMLYLYRTTDADGNKGYDYENVDYTLKLKDWGGTDSATPYTMFEFIFKTDSGEKGYQLKVEETDDGVQIRNNQPANNYLVSGSEVHYTFSDAEYALYTGEGVNVRVLREGTKISIYVNDEFKKSIYLPSPLENDDMARVRLQRDGDSGVQVDIPCKLSFPEKDIMAGKYISILGDGISMSAGIPLNVDGTSTADNNSTTAANNATDIYGNTIDQGIGSDWTKLYWGQSMITNGMHLLVNNSVSKGLLHANPHTNTYGGDTSKLQYYLPGYQRVGELGANQGTLAGTSPDIIYLYMGTEDRKQADPVGFEAKYKATLDTITATYPNAEVFCFTTMAYFDSGGYRGVGYSPGTSAARMKTVNDAITKLACQYENVTLVDIADIITIDNYKTYFPEGVTRVAPRVEAHDIIATRLQKALESQFSKE